MNWYLPKSYSDRVSEKGGTDYLKRLIDRDRSLVTVAPVQTHCPHCGIRIKNDGLPCFHCGLPTA